MGAKLDLTNKVFGRLTVLYENGKTNQGKIKWHCRCECGNELDVISSCLVSGHTTSCGCFNKERIHDKVFKDLTGKTFGNLHVIKLDHINKYSYWNCKCDCGKELVVSGSSLTSGKTKSCGCERYKSVSKSVVKRLEGKRFGRLTALYENGRDKHNNVVWHCKCDCGNEVDVRCTHLLSGRVLSCGCYAKDVNRKRLARVTKNDRSYPQWFIDELLYEEDKKRAIEKTLLSTESVYFNCDIHGKYKQRISDHLSMRTGERICSCPKCANSLGINGSKGENEIVDYIRSLVENITIDKVKILGESTQRKKEIDIYLPEFNLGIEYNGSVYHASINGVYNDLPKLYHQEKFLQAKKQKIHLLNIFDVDWETNKDKIKMYLKSLLTKNTKVFARKCVVKEVNKKIATDFCDKYHLQGNARMGTINYGLFYENKLLSVMCFGNLRFKNAEHGSYELHRYCVTDGYTIIGGASKLLKAFERDYKPTYILSYSDNDYFTGGIYKNLGFTNSGQCNPRYYWFYQNSELKRESCRLKYLKIDYPSLYSEACTVHANNKEIYIMSKLGARQVYRGGNTRWEKCNG